MIRALYTIAAPLLGRLGSAVIHAARAESDGADAAELNEARAMGRLDEAHAALAAERRFAKDDAARWQGMLTAATDDLSDQVRTLSTEVDRLREVERNGLADDEAHTLTAEALESVTVERDELQAENARIRNERDRSFAEVGSVRSILEKVVSDRDVACSAAVELQAEVDKARAERDEHAGNLATMTVRAESVEALYRDLSRRHGAMLVTPEPVAAAPCAWRLGPSESPFGAIAERADLSVVLPLCAACYGNNDVSGAAAIRARVATRAASCPARRASADPHAIDCKGCGAAAGVPCDLAKRRESDEAQRARDSFFGTGRSGRAG